MDDHNIRKQNLLNFTQTFCPFLFSILKDRGGFWNELTAKFSLKMDGAAAKIAAEEKQKTEVSIPLAFLRAEAGETIYISFLKYIDIQCKQLYETIETNLKQRVVGLFKRLFLEFDTQEQDKPNPTYLNGLSEIFIANKLIEKDIYQIVGIEQPLGNGKKADFTLLERGSKTKQYVEVVNIHLDSSKVESLDGFTLFVSNKLQQKYDDKTNNLPAEKKKEFYLATCIWGDDSVSDYIEQYGKTSPLQEFGILPPTSLVQYNNGTQKGFHFGYIEKDKL